MCLLDERFAATKLRQTTLPGEKLSNEADKLELLSSPRTGVHTRYTQKLSANYRFIVGTVYERRKSTEFGCSGAAALAATFAESATCSETTRKGRERSALQLLAVTYNFIGDSRRDRLKSL